MQRIRKDDQVQVMAGRSRGHVGRVVKMFPKSGRVMVEGANWVRKHTRVVQTAAAQEGGIIKTEAPVHMSNVLPVCPKCSKPTRVGFVIDEKSGEKTRQCKKCEGTF